MAERRDERKTLPSAREDAERAHQEADTPQTRSSSYRLAFTDTDFLLREELRPVRLQLELLKPELELGEAGIERTIVVFGSARIHPAPELQEKRRALERALEDAPGDRKIERQISRLDKLAELGVYYDEARRFGRLASRQQADGASRHYVIVTGGGPGIMEAANRGASDIDAVSIGHNIVLPHEQAPNGYITPRFCFQFHYFALRKMHLLTRARALVIFPGGFGTCDELFETLCLIQTGKSRPMPVLLFGESYWRSVINFEAMLDYGVIDDVDIDIFRYVETAEEAWSIIEEYEAQQPLEPLPGPDNDLVGR